MRPGSSLAGVTATRNWLDALPPELRAVTTTGSSSSSASVGTLITPLAASITAPAPATEKLRPAPEKYPAASTRPGDAALRSSRSAIAPLASGAACVTRSGPAASATLPAAFVAVTRQSRSTPSSAGRRHEGQRPWPRGSPHRPRATAA